MRRSNTVPPNPAHAAGLLGRLGDERAPPTGKEFWGGGGQRGGCHLPVGVTQPGDASPSPCHPAAGDAGAVRVVCGHHNWVAVGYAQFVACYRWVGAAQHPWVTPRRPLLMSPWLSPG